MRSETAHLYPFKYDPEKGELNGRLEKLRADLKKSDTGMIRRTTVQIVPVSPVTGPRETGWTHQLDVVYGHPENGGEFIHNIVSLKGIKNMAKEVIAKHFPEAERTLYTGVTKQLHGWHMS